MRKAVSDLETMHFLYEGAKTDWVASAAFYAMYHSLLSLLSFFGYESRNQECTINTVEHFIDTGLIDLEKEYIKTIRSYQEKKKMDAKSIRERFQYGTYTSMDDKLCKKLMQDAVLFVDRIKEVIASA